LVKALYRRARGERGEKKETSAISATSAVKFMVIASTALGRETIGSNGGEK
jgi:hypothetical protein